MANGQTAIGITLPLQRGKTGYFEQSFTAIDQIKSNLTNLLLTRKGERPFQPEFGSELHSLIFTQMDEEYDAAVQSAVQRSITQWMPFLLIVEMEVTRDDDRNRPLVKVTFAEKGGIGAKGVWDPVKTGLTPGHENKDMKKYIAGGFIKGT